jgi:hypothetical protein
MLDDPAQLKVSSNSKAGFGAGISQKRAGIVGRLVIRMAMTNVARFRVKSARLSRPPAEYDSR